MKAKCGNIAHHCFPKLISFSKIKKQQTPFILIDMYRVHHFSSYDCKFQSEMTEGKDLKFYHDSLKSRLFALKYKPPQR